MSHAREDHGQTVLVRRLDYLVIAHRAARLDDGRDAGFGRRVDAVAEREECVRRHDGTGYVEALVSGLDRRDPGAVDAAHLAGADADRHVVPAEDDGVRLHVLDDLPGEQHVVHLPGCRRLLGYDLEVAGRDDTPVGVLHEQATGYLPEVQSRGGVFPGTRAEDPDVFLFRERFGRLFVDSGRHDDFDKLPVDDCLRGRRVERLVERDDAAEGRRRVGPERLVVSFPDVAGHRHAAGIGVLDDDAGGRVELLDAFERRIRIGDVVVRERLALQLGCRCQRAGRRLLVDVERGILVRVFAIAHAFDEAARVQEAFAERVFTQRSGQVTRDGRIVTRRVRVGLGGKFAAHLE